MPGDSALTISPDPFGMGPPRSNWRGDLNADGVSDLIIRFPEGCGNWGECPYGAFVGCGGDAYAIVWSPEYVVTLGVDASTTEVAGSTWRNLVETVRTEENDGSGAQTSVLRFDGRAYQRVSRQN